MIPKVAVDTCTFVQAVPQTGPYHPIFLALKNRQFVLTISNDIIFEYEEILKKLGAASTWPYLLALLSLLQKSGHVENVDPSYQN
jgi:hypothetical protein